MSIKDLQLTLCCVVATLATIMASAQDRELAAHRGDSIDIRIYFPFNETDIDPSYMENRHSLQITDSLLKDNLYISTLDHIEITVQSSPEGTTEYNEQLSHRRRLSLEQYFATNYPYISSSLWSYNTLAENWDLFYQHLKEDSNIPFQKEMLYILDSNRTIDQKEEILIDMRGGRTWRYIKEHILPSHRFGASILFVPMPHIEPTAIPLMANITPMAITPLDIPLQEQPREQPQQQSEKEAKTLFAIKTNLLLDLVTAVNLALEIPIGNRLSVVGEVVYPWWRNWDRDFTMQIESYHGELKFWLGDRSSREKLTGWSLGAYGGWGRYDIQPLTRTGVQGSFTDYGLEVGYAHKIARNLHLEYNIGVGYLSTEYEDYKMVNETDEYGDIKVIPYPWMQNSLKSPLPTRCGVSLVWTIKSRGGDK